MLEIGSKALDFCLPNQDEEEICLRDFQGSWVVVYFYPRDNTPGCTTQACNFTENLPDFTKLGVTVLGISPDTPRKHRNFIEKKNLAITLLADENKEVANKYGVWQLKKSYGREYMGIVRSTFLINPDSQIAFIWKKVKVKGHIEAVKEKIKELQ